MEMGIYLTDLMVKHKRIEKKERMHRRCTRSFVTF